MPDDHQDPSGNTAAFRAFATREEAPAPSATPATSATPAAPANRMPFVIGGVVVAVVVIIVLVLALS